MRDEKTLEAVGTESGVGRSSLYTWRMVYVGSMIYTVEYSFCEAA